MRRLWLLLAPISALGFGAGLDAPWPGGSPPDPLVLERMVDQATHRDMLDRIDSFTMAIEDGKEIEIAGVPQFTVDQGSFSLEGIQRYGQQLFTLEFRSDLGYGGEIDGPGLRRVHQGMAGGRDSFSCAGCHSVGGLDGAGASTQNAFVLGDGGRASSAAARNPPSLLGAGLLQALAAEMTEELQRRREDGIERARQTGQPVEIPLEAKGIAFGHLCALPDGRVETEGLLGVDVDLVVRPFGWKGDVATLRDFVEEAARLHFGIQSARHDADVRQAALASGTDPGDQWSDTDQDGVHNELDEGTVTSTAVYLAMLETPVILPPHDPALQQRWAQGERLFGEIGCAGCHTRSLRLERRHWEERSPLTGGPPIRLNLLLDGDLPRGTDQVALLSDLRRHEMGPDLADPVDHPGGIPRSVFLTRPLWGLAETAPYLHDGRAATIPEAILAHGGEAQASRDAFAALGEPEQQDLHLFLLSLTRAPQLRIAR